MLLPLITLCRFDADQTIFKQGDNADHLYIIENGLVDIIFKPSDGPALQVSRLSRGGVFGWSSALGRDSYTSSAQAVMDLEAYRFSGQELRTLCEGHPETGVVLLDRLALAIAKRLESTHDQVMNVLKNSMDLK